MTPPIGIAARAPRTPYHVSGEDGEDLAVISRTLGHSQIATTADIYSHLTPAMLERTAARMDRVLTRRKRAAGA
jgi:integrase